MIGFDEFEPMIYSGNEIDEDNRKYFRTECICKNIFPNYTRCPMMSTIDRTHCSFLINESYCICDDFTHDDWLDYFGDLDDDEMVALLSEMTGVPAETIKENTGKLEEYLGLK